MTNGKLQAVRLAMQLSQDEFARALREAGERMGEPNDANKRLVQRWEAGTTAVPRPLYARALEAVTGYPVAELGFAAAAHQLSAGTLGGHDAGYSKSVPPATQSAHPRQVEGYTGIWISRYEYYSSGQEHLLAGVHHVVLLQHGDRLTLRSLPGPTSSALAMDLVVDGQVVTGTWMETTAVDGYYRGARHHGAIQLLVEPTGRRMAGKWCGFGRELEINSGPWELVFEDPSTSKATLERYTHHPSTT
ncbi:MAG: helix-turn-helix transcriptional regulator [Dactylosporangium sp.]|nr:helix-turn-helix domain-containing protein [Dactylosporangium sp.]NNJ59901.1 helix-turn-helix transcriptional regulator [Dactylosporangium sp.]